MNKIVQLTKQLEEEKGKLKRGIAARLKAARHDAGLTQEELSDLVGVSRTTITNIETGKQGITAYELIIICGALDVSSDALLGL